MGLILKKLYYPLTVLALFTAFFCLVPSYYEQSEALQNASLRVRDLFFRVRHLSSEMPPQAKDIVIVSIDVESSEKLGARWPWSRKLFAKLVDRLSTAGAKAVALNFSFTGQEGETDEPSQELADALKRHGNAVLGATFDESNHIVKPTSIIATAGGRYGYLEKIVDPDFTIRRSYLIRLYSSAAGAFESSFPLQVVAAQSGVSVENNAQFDADLGLITVGTPHRGLYVDSDGSYAINYAAMDSDFTRIPAWKVIEGKAGAPELRGKVVLVGLTSSLFGDIHPTPLGMLTGVGIHANEVLSVLAGRELKFAPIGMAFALAWLISVCVLTLFLFRRLWLGILGFLIALGGAFLGAQAAFAKDIVIEPFVLMLGPTLATLTGVFSNSVKLLTENRGLETTIIHDKMTGLYKYEYLRECLGEEFRRSKRAGTPISIVMTDLDRFKKINDVLGHEVGNEMIKRAGKVLEASARKYDVVSRYGGDEFVILLAHTNLEEAKAYRLRLRDMYHAMARALDEEKLKDSSISIGVASFDPKVNATHPPNPQALIEEADKDLFHDKESRRKPGEASR